MSPGHSPQARRARTLLNKAVKMGLVERPDRCEECSREPKESRVINAHHDDYRRPLDVRWLCSSCHSKHHWQDPWRKPHTRSAAWSAASERGPGKPIAPQVEQYRLQVCEADSECRAVMRINADGSGAWFDWPAIEELAALPDDDGDRAQVKMLCHVALAARQAGKDGR